MFSFFSGNTSSRNRWPPVPVIPRGAQAVWLNADDTPPHIVPEVRSKFSRAIEEVSYIASGFATSLVDVLNISIGLLSNEVRTISFKGSNSALSSHDTSLSFLNLLEGVSPHVQSVLLDKCTVLELSSLAFVSRSIRNGAIAAMAKRSLNISFEKKCYYHEEQLRMSHSVAVIHIEDISDPSRSLSVEFCNCDSEVEDVQKTCRHWLRIQRLLHFCGRASVRRMELNPDPPVDHIYYPNQFAMKSDHSYARPPVSPSECSLFVEELFSHSNEVELLQIISPRILKQSINPFDFFRGRVDAVFSSRAMLSAESIILECFYDDDDQSGILLDEIMLNLSASSITIYMPMLKWLRCSRDIKRVQTYSRIGPAVEFGKELVDELKKLDQPPKIDFSTDLGNNLKSKLQILNGKMIYEGRYWFSSDAAVLRITSTDGKELSVVVTKAMFSDLRYVDRTGIGFIDIFPST